MLKRKGVSSIIVDLILISLFLIAITIVWIVVKDVTQKNLGKISKEDLLIRLNIKNVGINEKTFFVTIKRGVGGEDFIGIRFIFSNQTDSEIIDADESLKELEEKKFDLTLEKMNPISVSLISVAPIFGWSSGANNIGNVLDTFVVNIIEIEKNSPIDLDEDTFHSEEIGNNNLSWQALYEPGSGGSTSSLAVSPFDSNRVLVGGDLLGAGLSEDGGETWQPTFGFLSWEIADFTFHPTDANTIWVGTLGGPYVSHDGGHNWQPKRNGFPAALTGHYTAPIQKILFDPNNQNRLLAFGGSHWTLAEIVGNQSWGAVWESLDSGESWNKISTIDGNNTNILSVAFASGQSDIIYIAAEKLYTTNGEEKGFYASTDGGKTWTARNNGLPHKKIRRLVAHPTEKDTLWVALEPYQKEGETYYQSGGIYKSTDAGLNWKFSSNNLSLQNSTNYNYASNYRTLAISQSNPNILLTNNREWGDSTTYKSTDGGESWTAVLKQWPSTFEAAFGPSTGPGMLAMTIDPNNPERMFVGGTAYVLKTTNGGINWTDATAYRPDSTKTDFWRGRGFAGICSMNVEFDPFIEGHVVLQGLDDGKFWESYDMYSWRHAKNVNTNGGGYDVTFADNGKTIYATFGQFYHFNGIGKTTNGGENWTTLYGSSHGLPEMGTEDLQPVGIHTLPNDSQKVWAVIGGKMYYSSNGGEYWNVIHNGPMGWIVPLPNNPQSFYVNGRYKMLYFTTDGQNFQEITNGPIFNYDPEQTRMTIDNSNPPRLYVANMWQDGLWKYENGNWTFLKNNSFISNVAVDPSDSNRIAITTQWSADSDISRSTGVWVSGDGGKNWTQQNNGLRCLRGKAIAFNPQNTTQLIFGSGCCGYFTATWGK